jgi:hypothetical protein
MATPGIINYRVIVKTAEGETSTFPGGFKGNPYAWDEHRNESWQTFVAANHSPLEIFNPSTDRSHIMLYNPDWRTNTVEFLAATKPNQLVMKATMNEPAKGKFMGWQYYFSKKIRGRQSELSSFSKIIIRARASQNLVAKLSLITTEADAYASPLALTIEWKEIEVPLSDLKKTSFLLLPRPYPGFQPLHFLSEGMRPLVITEAEKVEISFGEGLTTTGPVSIEVEWIQLQK